MANIIVKSGATVCASSADAHVTADSNEVLCDNPECGPGWQMLVSAAQRQSSATFSVVVTTGQGVNRLTTFLTMRCLTASQQQLHMSRPLPRTR